MKSQQLLAIFLIFATGLGPNFSRVYADTGESLHIRPPNVPARSNAEYYSASPEVRVVMPVNIWGNVREPGLHFLPIGSSLQQSISAAGGPSETADLSTIRILRSNKYTYADLLGTKTVPLQANDIVYVDHSYRADLPFIFSGISTILSIITLYYVMKPRNSN